MSILSHYLFRLFKVLSRHVPYFENLFRLLRFFTSPSTRRSADKFADTIIDYHSNTMKSKFILYQNCLQKKYNGDEWEFEVSIYFRSLDKLLPLEKKVIDLSYGNILDIGSSTGYNIPYLMEKGTVTGIEISPRINNIARKGGIDNCVTGDIFTYKFNKKFDTITLIGNDITISGTLYRLKKMLKRFAELLNENGQVLIIIRHIQTLKYWHVVFTPQYDGHFGIPFKCIFLNVYYFKKLATKYSFNANILGKDESTGALYYLIKLVKSSELQ